MELKKFIFIIFILLTFGSTAFAASSPNYHISAEVFDLGGGTSESSNYQILGKLRHSKPIQTTSASWTIEAGFIGAVYSAGVLEGYPVISSLDPSSGFTSDSSVTIEITGSGFTSGATVKLTKSGESDINGTGVLVSSTLITSEVDLTFKALGFWNVIVTNPGPKVGTLANGFQIKAPGPAVIIGTASNEPNPFNPNTESTTIKFKLSDASLIKLFVFNQLGDMVWRTQISGVSGDNAVVWDALSTFRESVPTGVYLCKIVAVSGGSARELGTIKIAVFRR